MPREVNLTDFYTIHLSTLCRLMSAIIYLLFVNYYLSTYVDLCRPLFVDLCLLFVDYMSTYVYLCRRICRLYVDICLLMLTYVNLC